MANTECRVSEEMMIEDEEKNIHCQLDFATTSVKEKMAVQQQPSVNDIKEYGRFKTLNDHLRPLQLLKTSLACPGRLK